MSDRDVQAIVQELVDYAHDGDDAGRAMATRAGGVTEALARLRAGCDPEFAVDGDGEALRALGDAVIEVDAFVGEIGRRLAEADSGTITLDMATIAATRSLPAATAVEREAGDLATATLLGSFDVIDAIKAGKTDGKISQHDLERAAKHPDPRVRAAAQWLLEHPDVLRALRGGGGREVPLRAEAVRTYVEHRAAYRVLMDHFDEVDAITGGKPDGKVSRKDLQRVVATTKDPSLRAAAQVLLADGAALGGHVTNPDYVAGRYDLDDVAKGYAEPKVPLPPKGNPMRDAVCGVAGFYSYLGWADLADDLVNERWRDAGTGAVLQVGPEALPRVVENKATRAVAAKVITSPAGRATAKSVATGATKLLSASPAVAAVATGVDVICRVTSGRDWGSVTPPPAVNAGTDPTKKGYDADHPGGVYPNGNTNTPWMDEAGVPPAP